mgnify:FL=1
MHSFGMIRSTIQDRSDQGVSKEPTNPKDLSVALMHHFKNIFYFFYIFMLLSVEGFFLSAALISDTEIKSLTYHDPSYLEENTWWRSRSCPAIIDLVT